MPLPVAVLFSTLTVRSPPVVSTNTLLRIETCGYSPEPWSSRVSVVHSKSCCGG